jgi:hypothetical protein
MACRTKSGGHFLAGVDIRGVCNLRNDQNNGQSENFFHGPSPLVRLADIPSIPLEDSIL